MADEGLYPNQLDEIDIVESGDLFVAGDSSDGGKVKNVPPAKVLTGIGAASSVDFVSHSGDTSNPHSTTAVQVGALADSANVIKDSHIAWGTGTDEVSADDVPDGTTNVIPTATQRTNWNNHLSAVDNPHSVTKTQVGLSAVTNDAQLKRADNDWSGFTEDTGPANTDLLLVEKETSGVKRKVQIGNLSASASIYNPTLLSNGNYFGRIIQGVIAGENLAQYDLVYLKGDGKWWKAKADNATTMPSIGMVTANVNAESAAVVLFDGLICNTGWSFTPGVPVYVDDDTAGLVTATYPPDAGDQVGFVGLALSATVLMISLNLITLEIA